MTELSGTFVILGSGTSTGVPMIGCDCLVCRSKDPRNQRTRCSALIVCDGASILIDTATDLRFQALRQNLRRIDAVLYTHTHADHVHGIDELRVFNLRTPEPIPLYGSAACVANLRHNFDYIFAPQEQGGFRPRLRLEVIAAPFAIGRIPLIPLPIRHGADEAYGYRIGDLAYLTDCNAIPETTLTALAGIKTLVIDALRFSPHDTHFTIPEAIAVAQQLGVDRTLLTHLSHDVDAGRHSAALPPGFEFACDGQELPFTLSIP